ncbi:ribosomal protein S18 acetylase RimI-like enzyme [Neolewinella xylanilytica]|uniref:Ribosomal protein S18 acetylase RimI-like enzyme n=1 Tax=Neolewinella xylanilytica TaxID=1514080 RepID=A0A2S6I0Y3_9BACT|nr:GNAT family N-acetyltransferase [Neolewinella xylanilytica]PPK84628.1 ribosomal protein S18 acetylase RimI-like enzyme [Neolewinella xylanilytica]
MNPTNVRILAAGPSDVDTIQRIARQTWPVAYGKIIPPEQIEYMLDRMYRPDSLRDQMSGGHAFHLLLYADDASRNEYAGPSQRFRAVGFVSHQIDHSPRATKIHKLYVLPGMQGRGLGKLLINEIAGIATRAGQLALKLDVNYRNPAIGFYEVLGFEKIERYDTDIGNGYLMEDWRMVKLLN